MDSGPEKFDENQPFFAFHRFSTPATPERIGKPSGGSPDFEMEPRRNPAGADHVFFEIRPVGNKK